MIIDQLPAIASPQAADEIPIERGTTTYKIRYDDFGQPLQDQIDSIGTDVDELKTSIIQSDVKTISSGGTKNYTLTGITADHVVGNLGMFSDSACTTPIPENAPTCDITVTTANGTWTALIENFTSTFYWKPTFIKD